MAGNGLNSCNNDETLALRIAPYCARLSIYGPDAQRDRRGRCSSGPTSAVACAGHPVHVFATSLAQGTTERSEQCPRSHCTSAGKWADDDAAPSFGGRFEGDRFVSCAGQHPARRPVDARHYDNSRCDVAFASKMVQPRTVGPDRAALLPPRNYAGAEPFGIDRNSQRVEPHRNPEILTGIGRPGCRDPFGGGEGLSPCRAHCRGVDTSGPRARTALCPDRGAGRALQKS